MSLYCIYVYVYYYNYYSSSLKVRFQVIEYNYLMINKEIIVENEKSASPMLIKASLRHHSPQQIYDYLYRQVGELGMKIKKKQAIIGFQNQQYYQRLINQHKIIMLHGKKIQFVPLAKADENYLASEQQEAPAQMGKSVLNNQGITFPEFKSKNTAEARINRCRLDMLDKVQELFIPTIEVTRDRIQHLTLQFRQKGPQQRQIFSLQNAIQKKLKGVQNRYSQDVLKINKFIQEFSTKPSLIDLEPTFYFDDHWEFPTITQKNMMFHPDRFFVNKDYFACKRLCAINGNQFAVSMLNNKKLLGRVRLYDVHKSDPKQSLQAEVGIYGLCRVNNYLLMGTNDRVIKYVNLEDDQYQIDSSSSLMEKPGVNFFQIKILKPSTDKPEILTLSTDYIIRKYQLIFQQMGYGLFSIFFNEKQALQVTENCITFEVINSSVILYGKQKSMVKYHIDKKLTKQIRIMDRPLKIKKFNNYLYACASSKVVEMVDLRTEAVVQTFHHMPKDLRCLQVIGEHSMMYGAAGEIGLLDDRKHELFPWKSQGHHKGRVYDILKLRQRIVSCDQQGVINSWKLHEDPTNPTAAVPTSTIPNVPNIQIN